MTPFLVQLLNSWTFFVYPDSYWITMVIIGIWTISLPLNSYDGIRTVIAMKSSINIINFMMGSLFNNANINFGPTYQNSHTANSINIGNNIYIGDNGLIVSKTTNKGHHNQLFKDNGSDSEGGDEGTNPS